MTDKVIFCIPTRDKPHPACVESLEKSLPLITGAGFDEMLVCRKGSPYISGARAEMLKEAQKAGGTIFIFIDDDLSWDAGDLLKLIQTEGDVVGGTYRTREDEEKYMGRILEDDNNRPKVVRADGAVLANCLPAGFLKVTAAAVYKFSRAYPELLYGPPHDYALDLFNHGAHDGLWWGEDYAFCRRWNDIGGKCWLVPDLNINHHTWDQKTGLPSDLVYKGNWHQYMMRQPGGALDPMRNAA